MTLCCSPPHWTLLSLLRPAGHSRLHPPISAPSPAALRHQLCKQPALYIDTKKCLSFKSRQDRQISENVNCQILRCEATHHNCWIIGLQGPIKLNCEAMFCVLSWSFPQSMVPLLILPHCQHPFPVITEADLTSNTIHLIVLHFVHALAGYMTKMCNTPAVIKADNCCLLSSRSHSLL